MEEQPPSSTKDGSDAPPPPPPHPLESPCPHVNWMDMPYGCLLRTVQLISSTPDVGVAELRRTGQVCRQWRSVTHELLLSDTAVSRRKCVPLFSQVEAVNGQRSVTTCAAVMHDASMMSEAGDAEVGNEINSRQLPARHRDRGGGAGPAAPPPRTGDSNTGDSEALLPSHSYGADNGVSVDAAAAAAGGQQRLADARPFPASHLAALAAERNACRGGTSRGGGRGARAERPAAKRRRAAHSPAASDSHVAPDATGVSRPPPISRRRTRHAGRSSTPPLADPFDLDFTGSRQRERPARAAHKAARRMADAPGDGNGGEAGVSDEGMGRLRSSKRQRRPARSTPANTYEQGSPSVATTVVAAAPTAAAAARLPPGRCTF